MVMNKFEIVVHSLLPSSTGRNERMVWCDENIGIYARDWDATVDRRGVVYTFYKEEHAVMFALKWL
jgi:hypothetical protein